VNELLALALRQLPDVIEAIKAHRAQADPTLPPLTDAEAIDILRQALDSTEAKDDLWLAAHPGA
jgi:plasmid stability protein